MFWYILSIALPIILSLYLLITDFCDLFPFNDVSKHTSQVRKWELLNYILPIIAAVCSWCTNHATSIIALLIATLYLAGHILSWWTPYFFGCSKERKQLFEDHFGRTIKILPPIKDHPIPNLEHLPVGLLIISWFAAALMTLI